MAFGQELWWQFGLVKGSWAFVFDGLRLLLMRGGFSEVNGLEFVFLGGSQLRILRLIFQCQCFG